MKIVYVSHAIIPSRTANSIHIMKMCQAFAHNGHDVTLLAPDRSREYESDIDDIYEYYGVQNNFKVKKLEYKYVKFVRTILFSYEIVKSISKINPDIVYGRYLYGCFLSSFGYKTFFESHAPMDTYLKYKLLKIMYKRKSFQKIIVISEALKKIIIKKHNIEADKLLVAHDGADEVFNREDKVSLYGENKNLNVGYVGHLYQGRGIELIIELAKHLKNMNFHIIGGTKKDIEYWQNYLNEYHIENFFFYGHMSPSMSVKFRNSFDILLAPYAKQVSVAGNSGDTSSFMSPLKIFEYMAHKKAMIVSDLPVLREVLNDNNAVLVTPEDVSAWIDALNRLSNSEYRESIALNAYMDFIKKYRWSDRAKKVIKSVYLS